MSSGSLAWTSHYLRFSYQTTGVKTNSSSFKLSSVVYLHNWVNYYVKHTIVSRRYIIVHLTLHHVTKKCKTSLREHGKPYLANITVAYNDITLHYTMLHYIIWYYTTLCYITLYDITLHYITLHYTTGAQECHIVSLLCDVTSPTTVAQ